MTAPSRPRRRPGRVHRALARLRVVAIPGILAVAVAAAWWRNAARAGTDGWVPAPVDLNAAGTAELTSLPGVGPALAAAIVADRDANGAFRSVEDLDRVRGIGPGLLARIRPHAVAGDAPAAAPAYAAR